MNQKHLKASWQLCPEQNLSNLINLYHKNVAYISQYDNNTGWHLRCIKHRFIPINNVPNITGFDSKQEAEVYLALIED